MTPIEEIRKRLDELGVEYDAASYDNAVFWGNAEYEMRCDGNTRLIVDDATPKQAIAATVGTEPDESTMLKLHDRMNAALLDYESAIGIDGGNGANAVPFVNEMHQIIEDAAVVGVGTCELINAADDLGEGTSSCMCFKCGYTALDDWWDEFKHCPNCGKRIEEEAE